MNTSAPAIRVNDDGDEVMNHEGTPSETKDKLPPIPKVTNFGDVVKMTQGHHMPTPKIVTQVEFKPILTYERISKRPPVQLMNHDEALMHMLSTE